MGFSCGIVGLPNVGKSTIYRALTTSEVVIEPFPFSTITPNIGVVDVPDNRIYEIARIISPETVVNTTLNFVDVAGLVEGASGGEGMGNQFLSHIRKVDAIAHVVRCFEDGNVPHISPELNPIRDIEIIELELMLKDIETIEKRVEKTTRTTKSGNKDAVEEVDLLRETLEELNSGTPVRNISFSEKELTIINELFLLSAKPQFFVANIGEENLNQLEFPFLDQVSLAAKERGVPMLSLCSKLEAEIADLKVEEREIYSQEMGIEESGLDNLISIGYELLNLITFFTTKSNEVRAWTVEDGTVASLSARKIHTDIEKGFIKADIIKCEDLFDFESEANVRENGLVQTVGRDHIIEDGDIIHFKFRS